VLVRAVVRATAGRHVRGMLSGSQSTLQTTMSVSASSNHGHPCSLALKRRHRSFAGQLGSFLRSQRRLYAAAHRGAVRSGMGVLHGRVRRDKSVRGTGDCSQLFTDVSQRPGH